MGRILFHFLRVNLGARAFEAAEAEGLLGLLKMDQDSGLFRGTAAAF
jgi:hypothetical protein